MIAQHFCPTFEFPLPWRSDSNTCYRLSPLIWYLGFHSSAINKISAETSLAECQSREDGERGGGSKLACVLPVQHRGPSPFAYSVDTENVDSWLITYSCYFMSISFL